MDGARNMNKYDTMLAVNKKRNKRKIELLEEQNEKLLKEMAALQEENNRLKKALGKRALNTIKNL